MPKTRGHTQKTILCVDDDAHMLSALDRMLSPKGYRVLTAPDGMQAISVVREEHPDLILLDVMMPGMSGLEVVKYLRETGLDQAPVVMVTGRDSSDAVMSGYREGAVYYITKPFRKEYVLNVVEYLIGDLAEEERQRLEARL